ALVSLAALNRFRRIICEAIVIAIIADQRRAFGELFEPPLPVFVKERAQPLRFVARAGLYGLRQNGGGGEENEREERHVANHVSSIRFSVCAVGQGARFVLHHKFYGRQMCQSKRGKQQSDE